MEINTMLDDKREIKAIYFNDAEGTCYTVGSYECDAIKTYGEPGMHCNLPFLAIYKKGEIHSRIPAHTVQITYA